MEYGNMLRSEDKILIEICGNLKDFLPEDSSRNTLTKIEKDKHRTTFCKSCALQFDLTHCRKPSATVIPNCRHHLRS